MSAPNDTQLVRVWTKAQGNTVAGTAFAVDDDITVVVDVEAGSTIFGGGTRYLSGICVRDLNNNDTIQVEMTPNSGSPGSMGDGDWPEQSHQFQYTIPSTSLAGRENHCCKVEAFLKARDADPNVSFAESPMFLLY